MNQKNNCLLCGEELIYHDTVQKMKCMICHREFETSVACQNGHYICDECHSGKGIELIVEVCKNTTSRNPIEIMISLMQQPAIHMHGPEHHVLVGASLLAAYHNSGAAIDLDAALEEMVRRGKQVPGGVCGFWGCCGAAVSTGMFISIITGSTPLKEKEWSLSNKMTSISLDKISEAGGPRCCKRDSFLAVQSAVEYVKQNFDVYMEIPEKIICEFSELNKQCIGKKCPFSKKNNPANH